MKKTNTNIKSYLALIKKIEKVRSRNNKNWMDLYRLAFEVAPSRSIKIIINKPKFGVRKSEKGTVIFRRKKMYDQ